MESMSCGKALMQLLAACLENCRHLPAIALLSVATSSPLAGARGIEIGKPAP
jgi:hypothetical protein